MKLCWLTGPVKCGNLWPELAPEPPKKAPGQRASGPAGQRASGPVLMSRTAHCWTYTYIYAGYYFSPKI